MNNNTDNNKASFRRYLGTTGHVAKSSYSALAAWMDESPIIGTITAAVGGAAIPLFAPVLAFGKQDAYDDKMMSLTGHERDKAEKANVVAGAVCVALAAFAIIRSFHSKGEN